MIWQWVELSRFEKRILNDRAKFSRTSPLVQHVVNGAQFMNMLCSHCKMMSISNPAVATAAALLLVSKCVALTGNFLLMVTWGDEHHVVVIVVAGVFG